jgi:hypothetical protein
MDEQQLQEMMAAGQEPQAEAAAEPEQQQQQAAAPAVDYAAILTQIREENAQRDARFEQLLSAVIERPVQVQTAPAPQRQEPEDPFGNDPNADVEELGTQGFRAIAKRGFVHASQIPALVAKEAARIADERIAAFEGRLSTQAQFAGQYQQNLQDPAFQRALQLEVQQIQQHAPHLAKDPAILAQAAQTVKLRLELEAFRAGKNPPQQVDQRRASAAAQAPMTSAAAGGAPALTIEQRVAQVPDHVAQILEADFGITDADVALVQQGKGHLIGIGMKGKK